MNKSDWIAVIIVLGIAVILGGLIAYFGVKPYKH
jgi:hypothetical protein